MTSIKSLLQESPGLTSIPCKYIFTKNPEEEEEEEVFENQEVKIPTIDFSLLTSDDVDQRSQAIAELGQACENWGFFMVSNHGVAENVISEVIEGCSRFFNMNEEEKLEFSGRNVLDPIRYGTSFNASVDKVLYWRDYLKVMVNPHFHFPNKPSGFSEIASEYCKGIKRIVKVVVEGISESLGLEGNYIEKSINLESGLQIFAANLYPPCPQPDIAMGMPPHSDQGLLTFLIQNGIGGLQIHHNGKWVNVNPNIPNSLMVNTCDHLEILSNGKYKSVVHRAIVNRNATRISLAIANGPSLESVISPVPKLVEESVGPVYTGMKYKDYLEIQQSNTLNGKSMLDHVRLI